MTDPRAPATERVGVLGGTFDPPHIAHVHTAVVVRDALGLDRVLVVPTGQSWQKAPTVEASAGDRLAMSHAAFDGLDRVTVCSMEVERPGPTVTADTMEALTEPGRALYLVLGADAVARLPTWRRVDVVRRLTTLVVMDRAGEPGPDPGPGWRVERVAVPRLDVSSRAIRAAVATGRPVDGLVPAAVVHLIEERSLYTRP